MQVSLSLSPTTRTANPDPNPNSDPLLFISHFIPLFTLPTHHFHSPFPAHATPHTLLPHATPHTLLRSKEESPSGFRELTGQILELLTKTDADTHPFGIIGATVPRNTPLVSEVLAALKREDRRRFVSVDDVHLKVRAYLEQFPSARHAFSDDRLDSEDALAFLGMKERSSDDLCNTHTTLSHLTHSLSRYSREPVLPQISCIHTYPLTPLTPFPHPTLSLSHSLSLPHPTLSHSLSHLLSLSHSLTLSHSLSVSLTLQCLTHSLTPSPTTPSLP